MRVPLMAGNWKMFKTIAEARPFVRALHETAKEFSDRDIAVCPPFTALPAVTDELKDSRVAVGAQNVHWEKQGAYTGEISPGMLTELGCRYAIIGHSERRQFFGETDATVNKRMLAAEAAGLTPIVCIGELLAERQADKTFEVLAKQINEGLQGLSDPVSIVIAYEPVWAIGTGRTASPDQAQEAHAVIRKEYGKLYSDKAAHTVRILYGGSIKPDNIAGLMKQPDIDGGLVGGASLDLESFTSLIKGMAL